MLSHLVKPRPVVAATLKTLIRQYAPMALFKEGEAVWVQQPDGSERAGVFVGDGENATWFGGAPLAYVVYPDTKDGEEVNLARVTARDENDTGS